MGVGEVAVSLPQAEVPTIREKRIEGLSVLLVEIPTTGYKNVPGRSG